MAQSKHLQKWFPHTTTPFIANAPMFGFADYRLAAAVTKAGGLGMWTVLLPAELESVLRST